MWIASDMLGWAGSHVTVRVDLRAQHIPYVGPYRLTQPNRTTDRHHIGTVLFTQAHHMLW